MTENETVMVKTITALLEQKKYPTLRDILVTMMSADIAMLFSELDEKALPLLFRLLPKELAAETFVEMDAEAQELLIRGFSDNELKEVLDELYLDDAVDIVEEMPANVVKRILQNTDPDTRKMINELLKYPEDSAGSIMTVEYVSLRPAMTAEEAIKRIRRTGVDKETIYTCYVTDDMRHLLGMVSVRTLLLSDEDEVIKDIMEDNVISVHTSQDKEEVVNLFNRYNFLALPVVDDETRLVGIVTFDDAMDVLEDEATEDIEKMAAITPSDKPYLKTGVFSIYKSRIPWLALLMVSATFTGLIINSFESALAAEAALISFIPMLMGTGGNSGSQAAVTVIRSMTVGDVKFSDVFRVIWKELRVAVMCGISLAVIGFVKFLIIDRVSVEIALTVSVTIVVIVIVSKLVGCTLPMLANRLGLDPTVMASPLITTVLDSLSLLTFFVTARLVLKL